MQGQFGIRWKLAWITLKILASLFICLFSTLIEAHYVSNCLAWEISLTLHHSIDSASITPLYRQSSQVLESLLKASNVRKKDRTPESTLCYKAWISPVRTPRRFHNLQRSCRAKVGPRSPHTGWASWWLLTASHSFFLCSGHQMLHVGIPIQSQDTHLSSESTHPASKDITMTRMPHERHKAQSNIDHTIPDLSGSCFLVNKNDTLLFSS